MSRPSCSESFSELRFHPGSHPRARSSTHHSPGPPWESGPPQSLPMGGSACTWAWEPQTDVALHFLFYLIATMRPTLPLILQIHLHLNTHACVTYRQICYGCVCVQSLSCVQLCSPSGSSVHGIFQARILEWAGISFSRGSSQPRD